MTRQVNGGSPVRGVALSRIGSPVRGARVTVTNVATGQPATVYADPELSTVVATPTADSSGVYSFYLQPGATYALAFSGADAFTPAENVQVVDPDPEAPPGAYVTRKFTVFTEDVARVSPDLNAHQGYATDGTHHFVFDNAHIDRLAADWSLLATNVTPFAGLGTLDHMGAGCWFNGKLYVPMQHSASLTSGDTDTIAVFNDTTLALVTSRNIAADISPAFNMASLAIRPDEGANGTVYLVGFPDQTTFYKFDASTLAFVGTLTPEASSLWLAQGFSYYDGVLYVGTNDGHIATFDADTGEHLGVVARSDATRTDNWAHEGVDVTTGELRWLIDKGAGDRRVHFFTVAAEQEIEVTASGQVVISGAAPPEAAQVFPGYGEASGIVFGAARANAVRMWRSDPKTTVLTGKLRMFRRGGGATGYGIASQNTTGNLNNADDSTWTADRLLLGATAGASADFMAARRIAAGRGNTDHQFQALDGIATKDLGAVDGLNSAAIDALFSVVPVNGQIATGTLDGYPVLLARRNGTWSYTTLLGAAGRTLSAVASADVVRNNTASAAADPDLAIAVAANATYEVGGFIIYDSATAADFRGGWTLPSGGSGDWSFRGLSTSGSTDPGQIVTSWAAMSSNKSVGGVGVGTIVVAELVGRLVTTTAGTLTFKWSQVTADATDTTRRAGSLLRLTRLT